MKLNYKECLLIEDLPIDQEIAKLKIVKSFPNLSVIKIDNGKKGIDFVQQRLDTGQALPFLILIDINMPIFNGFDFIEGCIKMGFKPDNKPKIAILTSSIHPADIKKARFYKIVDEFLVKPLDTNQLKKLMPFS
jgi:CheY-like chemotaxis protein